MAEWRRIPGTPYAASSDGRIRREDPGRGAMVGHVLAQHGGGGRRGKYLRVSLSIDGKRMTRNVHMLVAIAFHGDRRAEGMTVDHADEDPENNVASNLRWIPSRHNYRNGSLKRWNGHSTDGSWMDET